MDDVILETRNLRKYFPVRSKVLNLVVGWVKAVDNVSLKVMKGETLGLVGESGCGKSTYGKTIEGIYTPTEGHVYFQGVCVDNLPLKKKREFWRSVQYLHQDPASCLDPWWTIGRSIREPLMIHEKNLSKKDMDHEVRQMLEAVGLEGNQIIRYPHEFSGGQQRRIGLARVLILNPSVIIFDEPTSGLDVSVQATILKLLEKIKDEFKLTYIHISHNLEVIRLVSSRMAVMYLGRIVEIGDAKSLWEDPLHPYTKILFAAVPKIYSTPGGNGIKVAITGEPPNPQSPPPGCHFHPRCPVANDICTIQEPVLKYFTENRQVSCHKINGGK